MAAPLLRSVDLFDIYRGRPLADDERASRSGSCFAGDDRTLTEAEVDAAVASIAAGLAADVGGAYPGLTAVGGPPASHRTVVRARPPMPGLAMPDTRCYPCAGPAAGRVTPTRSTGGHRRLHRGISTVDLLLFGFFAFFILGFAQGTIRRLIGIGSILFSFLFAANLAGCRSATSSADNWTQFPPEYRNMIGFGTSSSRGCVVFAIVAQGFYKPQPLFEKARFVDEILGGILGLSRRA